jgi:hypothetical protein
MVSCGLPGSSGGPPSNAPCMTLLQVGFAEPPGSPQALVVSYTTVSPLPSAAAPGGLLSVALSRGSPRVGVTHHLALRSPDLPRGRGNLDRAAARSDSVGGQSLRSDPEQPSISWRAVADTLVRPTRRLGRTTRLDRFRSRHLRGTLVNQRPFLVLLQVGFTQPRRSPSTLVVSYTTVSPLPAPRRRSGVAVGGLSLWHFPASHLGWALPTTLSCGVRTFLEAEETSTARLPGR